MKKIWITILVSIVIMIGASIALAIYNGNSKKENYANKNEIKIEEVSEENIIDDCIDEYEQLEQEEIEANANTEKISPNCKLTLKKFYTECGHVINEYLDIPQELVNKEQNDLQREYPNWTIEKFSNTDIILYKEFDSQCGQHFILRNNDGKITIYTINENNEEEFYERTEISVEYLPESDKVEIENGIRVNSKEELNELLENYE